MRFYKYMKYPYMIEGRKRIYIFLQNVGKTIVFFKSTERKTENYV